MKKVLIKEEPCWKCGKKAKFTKEVLGDFLGKWNCEGGHSIGVTIFENNPEDIEEDGVRYTVAESYDENPFADIHKGEDGFYVTIFDNEGKKVVGAKLDGIRLKKI